ncbi:MAG TPA: hypothetical protein ENN80_02375, partial [Candidatus Hydrogenedentes bacterium]|nr:hypothetical protein [Candidatus Hydrogenedentota bacterium]
MHWILAILLGVAYIAAYALGLWLAHYGRRLLYPVFAACFALIGLSVYFYYVPEAEYALSIYYLYTVIQNWWPPIAAFVLLGIGTLRMTGLWKRIAVAACAWLAFAILVQGITARVLFDPSECTGAPDWRGICPQTTDFTCGAAAAATLLAHFNIEATEREMAVLCWSNNFKGTNRFHICKALHQKLRHTPYRPRLMLADYQTLVRQNKPCMTTINVEK